MSDDDAFAALERDHDELDRDVRELAVLFAGPGLSTTPRAHLASILADVRDELVVHFVREEETLFSVLARHSSGLATAVDSLIAIHDEICATASRLVYLAQSGSHVDTLMPVFRRFEAAYEKHVHAERALLEQATESLTPTERVELADLVRAL